MAGHSERESGEKLQVTILTFAMTGGLFALVTLLLVLFLNPSEGANAKDSEKKYNELKTILLAPEMKTLRAQARLSEGQGDAKGLSDILRDRLGAYQLEFMSFPEPKPTQLKAGLVKQEIDLPLKPAKLVSILQFIGAVKDAKKTIQVETVTINRDRRTTKGAEEEDSWTATIKFVDYVSK